MGIFQNKGRTAMTRLAVSSIALFFLVMSWWPVIAGGAVQTSSPDSSLPNGSAVPGGYELLFRAAGSLLLVVVLLFGVVYLLRRYVFVRNNLANSDGAVKILTSTFIGPKKSIHLVKVLNRVLVLGVSESGMETLSEFNADEVETLLAKKIPESKEQPFSRLLQSIISHVKS